jgi:putative heme-binding domain-containing protein
MNRNILAALLWLVVGASGAAAADHLQFESIPGPGGGKHVVLLAGDEEYRSEEGLPMLAKILSKRHGFRCSVLFSVDDDGKINPNKGESLTYPEALDSADVIVMALRFRHYPDAVMQRFDAAVKRGVPIIGLRTSTHAFSGLKGTYASYNSFGENVLGESWVSHWGSHKHEATRGVIEPANKDNPLLRGVADVFANSDVYEAYPPADATILLRGQVLKGMQPGDAPADYRKKRATDKAEQQVNSPMMAVAWSREYRNSAGTINRILCTTMGAATDLQSEGLRRLVVNGVYWGLKLDVPAKADVDYIDAYQPLMYGFNGHRRGIVAADHEPGKVLRAGDQVADAGKKPAKKPDAKDIVAAPKVARPPAAKLPPSKLPLELTGGERIAFVGNSTAERMNLFGNFETRLHLRFPAKELKVRNFARPADEVSIRQRGGDYIKLDDPLAVFNPDTILCFFGFNESFAGPKELEKFKGDYRKFLDEYAKLYARDDAGSSPRFVLVSPIAFEPTGDPYLPEGKAENDNLKLYAEAVRAVAEERGLAYIDLLAPTAQAFALQPGLQNTINGCHVNEVGDKLVGELLDSLLFGEPSTWNYEPAIFEKLRVAVNDKSWVHEQDYRMLNGWYVYGGRRTWDTETFPKEYVKIRNMAAVRDQRVWSIAQGKPVAEIPDDSKTGELFTPQTRFGEPRQKYSESPDGPRILPPDELIKTCSVPPGFEIKLFADEKRFPEVAKPVQLNFDSKGRLWVSTMPSYPLWKPGDPKPSDKLVILEDTDQDGMADKSTVFYDKLHCPVGFEFFNGGVLVVDQPRLIWLKDTDGDDKADVVVHMFDGWATEDTHHSINAWEWSNAGLLHMLEGVAMSTAVETPWGPMRNYGSSGCYVLDPRTWKIRHFNTPGYGNPWCYVFDEWGQGFCGDGTGANQHWDTPLSGQQYQGRKGLNAVFPTEGMRPVVGSEFLVTRQFPDDVQKQFIYACVINMNGLPRWTFADDGGGYKGTRVRHDPADPKTAFDLLKSTEKHFRPVDPQLGPDGALWFGDWANPLIGHMQYSQRDPNRDHVHGRLYRLVYTGKPLLKPVTQEGKSVAELLDQLKDYEWRTRYRARREIHARPMAEVLAAVTTWLGRLDPTSPDFDRLCCEALWVQQSFHAVDMPLLQKVLAAHKPEARAAATRVLADERERIPSAFDLLKVAAVDEHPRVRTEAVRGLSFIPTAEAAAAELAALNKQPSDTYVQYTAEAALGANLNAWRVAYLKGELTKNNPDNKRVLDSVIALDKKGAELLPYLQILLGKDPQTPEQRNKAMQALADMRGGNVENGKTVFRRSCVACHKVYGEGADFGPDMMKVGTRLIRTKIVESIIDPNAEIDQKFLSTQIITSDGRVITGLLVSDDKNAVVIFDGKEKKTIPVADIEERHKLKQSSMPEGLAGTLSPVEFLDVIAFLSSLK